MYQMSKLHFFNFLIMLADHLDEDAFKICYIDTDSVLIAYTSETLDGIVKDGKVFIVFSLFQILVATFFLCETF